MKTTIEIADALFEQVQTEARQHKTTFRALTEEGLRLVLATRREPKPKKLPLLVTFGKEGGGLRPEYKDASWETIRDEIYKGHGA